MLIAFDEKSILFTNEWMAPWLRDAWQVKVVLKEAGWISVSGLWPLVTASVSNMMARSKSLKAEKQDSEMPSVFLGTEPASLPRGTATPLSRLLHASVCTVICHYSLFLGPQTDITAGFSHSIESYLWYLRAWFDHIRNTQHRPSSFSGLPETFQRTVSKTSRY